MNYQHKDMASGKWFALSFPEQMEFLVDYFAYDNEYKSSDESWQKYFLGFNYLARLNIGK